ncbi:disease resistance CC-NBS-LRR class family protein [Tanacetum coccineum]
MIFLRRHLHEDLKKEYLTVKDPLELWEKLKERFDHPKQVIFQKARYDLNDSQVTEEDMLEKNFLNFPCFPIASTTTYRECGFKKYHELISTITYDIKLHLLHGDMLSTAAAGYSRIKGPSASHYVFSTPMVSGREPSWFHLKVFGCGRLSYHIPPQRYNRWASKRLGNLCWFVILPSIIKYLDTIKLEDVFYNSFADCQFDETMFPILEEKIKVTTSKILTWLASQISFLDLKVVKCGIGGFKDHSLATNSKLNYLMLLQMQIRVTKSLFSFKCTSRFNIPETLDESKCTQTFMKGDVQVGFQRYKSRRRKASNTTRKVQEVVINKIPKEINNNTEYVDKSLEDDHVPNEYEISINFVQNGTTWNRNKTRVDEIFAYAIASEIINDEITVPKSIGECRQRNDWQKWQDAIQAELDSLEKRQVFGPVTLTPNKVKPVGYKWVFAIKRNEKNEIVRYKARLVAQGFSQIPGVDYEETYSPVVDATTLRFLISLANVERLQMRLMDVVTAYLYGSLDSDIYMKIPEGMKMPEACKSKPREMLSIKLKRSLYGLKQSGRMWYNRLSEYLSKEGYKSNQISPCVFIKRSKAGFTIIAVYVDDLNIIGNLDEIEHTANLLKNEFEMKDLEHDEDILGPEIPYLSAIGALMYLASNTVRIIAFRSKITSKDIVRGQHPTLEWKNQNTHLSLSFGTRGMFLLMEGHFGIFLEVGRNKQSFTATSSNHAELIALYEAGRECVWLRSLIKHIQEECVTSVYQRKYNILYEDNAVCIVKSR